MSPEKSLFLVSFAIPSRKTTHIVLESRGNAVDQSLGMAFYRIISKNAARQSQYPLKILFVDKRANNIGLQIADLVAYPIGRFLVDPERENLSFDIFQNKFHKYPDHVGEGLKMFPDLPLAIQSEKRKASEHMEHSEA